MALKQLKVAKVKYDFSVDGGSQGDIDLADNETIPAGAIVTGVSAFTSTAVTSAGAATVALKVGDKTVTDAEGKAEYGADEFKRFTIPADQDTKVDTAGTIKAVVGTADLTAGVVEFMVEYVY